MRILRPRTCLVIAAGALSLLAAGAASHAGSSPTGPGPAPGLMPGALAPLLLAEFSARHGGEANASRAARSYMDAARPHGSAPLAARAARLAALGGDYRMAAEASALWLELQPQNEAARRVHALMLVRSGQAENAAAALRDLVRRSDGPPGSGYDGVVEVLGREPDPARRIRVMEALSDAAPESRFALARVLARSGQAGRGRKVLEVLRREVPEEDRYTASYARLLHRGGELEAALRVLAARREKGGESTEVLHTYARLLVAAGRRDEARIGYEALLARSPDDVRARVELGRLLLEMERFSEARPHFEKLRRWPVWRDAAWFFLGEVDEALAEPDQALRAYRRVREGPYYVIARIRAATILADTGRLRQARRHLAATPRHTEADDVRLYRVESDLLFRADRPREAMKVLDTALGVHPGQPDLLYMRAMAAVELDRLDAMEQDLRSIIARDPNHADALNALGYTLADRTDRFEEAHALIARALALEPDNHHIVDSMGWVLYRLGRYAEAAEHLRRSYEMRPHPEVAAHLGEVLWVLGRRREAWEIWNSAREATPDDEVLIETMERFGS